MKDCYATGNAAPSADSSQDWVLLEANEQDGYTMLKYKRKIETCDTQYDRAVNVRYLILTWCIVYPSLFTA
jgi:hypothetical protein